MAYNTQNQPNYSYNGYSAGTNRFYPQYSQQQLQQPQQVQNLQQNQQLQQPQMQMQPMFSPQMQMQMQQPIQQNFAEPPIQEIRYLNADEIRSYIVMAGCKSMLIDKENKLVHIKSADMNGQSSVKIFSYDEYKGNLDNDKNNNQSQINLDILAKKEDLGNFVSAEEFKQFSSKLQETLSNIEKKIKITELLQGEQK